MKFTLAAALAFLSVVSAAPLLTKRQDNGTSSTNSTGINDVAILQYALTLEHLEATFYSEALSKFDSSAFTSAGFDSSVRGRIAEIGQQEATHVSFLSTALSGLNETPTAACNYSFGLTDVKTFLATAGVIEGVGVSAYLGAAASISEKAYLTAAGAILTVEARHTSYIRELTGSDPFPSAFDTPLDFNEVYSIASAFITSCPSSNPTLPVKAFPALTATASSGSATPGGSVKLTPASGFSASGQLYAAFIGLTGTQFGEYNNSTMTVTIPSDAAGQTYVVLSTSNTTFSDDTTVAGPAIIEVVPSSSS